MGVEGYWKICSVSPSSGIDRRLWRWRWLATFAGKAHLVGHNQLMVMPCSAKSFITLVHHRPFSGSGRMLAHQKHDIRIHSQERAMATRCFWPPWQALRHGIAFYQKVQPFPTIHERKELSDFLLSLPSSIGQRWYCPKRTCGEEVEVLETIPIFSRALSTFVAFYQRVHSHQRPPYRS